MGHQPEMANPVDEEHTQMGPYPRGKRDLKHPDRERRA